MRESKGTNRSFSDCDFFVKSKGLMMTILFLQIIFSEAISSTWKDIGEKNFKNRLALITRWKSIDRKTNPETFSCSSAHRCTPRNVGSNTSQGILSHLLGGRPVCLVTVTQRVSEIAGNSPLLASSQFEISYTLFAHGEELFLHEIRQNSFHLHEISDQLGIYHQNLGSYRVKDFNDVFSANLLRLPKISSPNVLIEDLSPFFHFTTLSLDKSTKFFPYLDSDTVLFSKDQSDDLKMLIDPVKTIFKQEHILPEDVEAVIAVIPSVRNKF